METIFHKADSRGYADHGWLRSYHSFSFAGFYHPEKMGFGLLRVLNDDRVAAGMGFGTHPHDNMEIISIPLSGSLRHKDDMGNTSAIQSDEVQVMSAGTGVRHSEFNNSPTDEVNFLQLWILPEKRDITPRYEQKYFDPKARQNQWQELVSPKSNGAIWINQDAYLSRTSLEKGKSLDYQLHKNENGVYLFLIDGRTRAGEQVLEKRDALGVWETDGFSVEAISTSEVLLIEVPMTA